MIPRVKKKLFEAPCTLVYMTFTICIKLLLRNLSKDSVILSTLQICRR